MNFTPQVETAEISDVDLDNVSGGLAGGVSGGGFLQAGPLNVVGDIFAAASPEGAAASVGLTAAH